MQFIVVLILIVCGKKLLSFTIQMKAVTEQTRRMMLFAFQHFATSFWLKSVEPGCIRGWKDAHGMYNKGQRNVILRDPLQPKFLIFT